MHVYLQRITPLLTFYSYSQCRHVTHKVSAFGLILERVGNGTRWEYVLGMEELVTISFSFIQTLHRTKIIRPADL